MPLGQFPRSRNKCTPCTNEVKVAWNKQLKQQTFDAYGGKCICCGENNYIFLSIDHIDGSGAEHRKLLDGGRSTYTFLKKQGFPKGNYQLLCFNCNFAKHAIGICPHQSR